jgi:hypothetical protein
MKMIDQLLSSVKGMVGEQLAGKVNFDQTQLEKTMEVTKESVLGGLKKEALGGNVSGILNLFNGKDVANNENPIVSSVSNMFVVKAIEKLGVNAETAMSLSNTVVPLVMQKFASKDETGEAKSELELMDLIGFSADSDMKELVSGYLKKGTDLLGGLGGLFK